MLNVKKLLAKIIPSIQTLNDWKTGYFGLANASGASFNHPNGLTSYLLVTGHNSTPALNGIWFIRAGGSNAFKLCGGGNVTVTVTSTKVTVKTTAGAVGVSYIPMQMPL